MWTSSLSNVKFQPSIGSLNAEVVEVLSPLSAGRHIVPCSALVQELGVNAKIACSSLACANAQSGGSTNAFVNCELGNYIRRAFLKFLRYVISFGELVYNHSLPTGIHFCPIVT